MAANAIPLRTDQALRNGFHDVADPGASGTISFHNKGMAICKVITATAESRALPSATGYAVGTHLIVILTTAGDLSITGGADGTVVLTTAGEVAEFVVSVAGSTNEWRQIIASVSVADFALGDNVLLEFGDASDITMGWDGTDFDVLQAAPNSSIKFGIDGAGIDIVQYGDTAGVTMTWDQSADSLIFTDNGKVVFGTGSDIAITWNATLLAITQAAPNSAIDMGVDGAGIDVIFRGDTAGVTMTWDQSADSLILTDNGKVVFGTGSDIAVAWNATLLAITQAAPNSAIDMGVDGAGIDVIFRGDTASQSMTWDQSADSLVVTSLVGLVGASSTRNLMAAPTARESIAAATGGAINPAVPFTTVAVDAGGDAFTMAAGSQVGQIKEIQLNATAGGTAVVTVATLSGGNTITFTAAGAYWKGMWNGTAWISLAYYNQATGVATDPAITTV